MNISVLVPTKNRSNYISRLIHYYETVNFKGEIFLLDSSDKIHSEKIIKSINKTKLTIKYFHSIGYPGMVMKKFLSEVKTDYIVETGDDDFLIIDGLKKLISFLRTNSDYSGVNGQCINIFSSKNINEIDGISFYEMCKRKEKDQLLRLKNHFKEYRVPNFSVFRKSTFKKVLSHIPDYEDIHLCPDREIVDELIQSSFSVIYTKIFKLKTLYLVRHITPIRQNTLQEIRYKDLDLFKKSKEFLESSILNALKKRNPDQSIKELINDYFHTNKNNKNNLKNIQIMYKRFINIFKFIFLKNIENNMDFKRIKNIILKFEMEC